jgi:menaquinone-dependent protoporphyrinogen oxidase
MRVLVVYASRLGATEGIAERIAGEIRAAGAEVSLQRADAPAEIAAHDAFVVGSAVYAGHWLKEATEFVRRNRVALASRAVWLFSSGPVGDTAVKHKPVEPKEIGELRRAVNPRDHRIFSGALDRSTVDAGGLGFAERVVAKTLIPQGDFRDWEEIAAWAGTIARDLA